MLGRCHLCQAGRAEDAGRGWRLRCGSMRACDLALSHFRFTYHLHGELGLLSLFPSFSEGWMMAGAFVVLQQYFGAFLSSLHPPPGSRMELSACSAPPYSAGGQVLGDDWLTT